MNRPWIAVALLCTSVFTVADVLPPAQDSSSLRGRLTSITGRSGSLPVTGNRKAYVRFNLQSLPSDVQPTDIAQARLRVFFPRVTTAGEINIYVVTVSTPLWDETHNVPEPGIAAMPVARLPVETVVGKTFAEVDITDTVQKWHGGTLANLGLAFVASGSTNVLLGAKEGAGIGFPCVLEVEIDRALRSNLTLSGTTSGSFFGDGSALTMLNANSLSSGTVADARLSSNVPLLSAPTNTFIGTVTASSFSGDGSGLTGVKASSFADAPTDVFPKSGMVWIKPGTFLMGSPQTEQGRNADETQHGVTLTKGFWMSVHEVTQAEYLTVTGSNPSTFTGDTNRPVEQISWPRAAEYCTTLTTIERNAGRISAQWAYRLPTEAEWEYCCRAGARTTRFSYGDDLSYSALGNYAWIIENSGDTTHPVEQKLGNPWGLMDMHGNVFEWCKDWYGDYPTASVTDPQGPPTGTTRVIRGGSWAYPDALCRSAQRNYGDTSANTFPFIGFRVVLAPL
jgi:formylglycine-generating enzyme required for sulfatase activity